MKIFVINLDRRIDRWALIREHLAEVGLSVKRFTAFDEKPGWVGCRESHLCILDEIQRYREPVMILEDDAEFVLGKDVVNTAMSQLPEDWDMLYLGVSPRQPQERYSTNLFKLNNACVTHAIIWHPRQGGAIEFILNHRDDIKKIDDYFATVIQPKFNCFVVYPMVCVQRQTQSDTCGRSDVSTIIDNYKKYCI